MRQLLLHSTRARGCRRKHLTRCTVGWGGEPPVRTTLVEWLCLVEHVGVFSPYLGQREAGVIFKAALFDVINPAQDWQRMLALTFTGFLEAFCRLADALFLPLERMLKRWDFDSVAALYHFAHRLALWDRLGYSGPECCNDLARLACWIASARGASQRVSLKGVGGVGVGGRGGGVGGGGGRKAKAQRKGDFFSGSAGDCVARASIQRRRDLPPRVALTLVRWRSPIRRPAANDSARRRALDPLPALNQ